MKYRKLTEVNDIEGETWHWFIPIKGNKKALEKLADVIKEEPFSFQLSEDKYTEKEVDTLTANGDVGYHYQFNKLTGKLGTLVSIEDLVGKGEIREWMENA